MSKLNIFSAEPFVPIGVIVTTVFLVQGFKAFKGGDQRKAQVLMRGRVVAQAFTVAIMCAGTFMGFKLHDRPKTMEEKMARSNDP